MKPQIRNIPIALASLVLLVMTLAPAEALGAGVRTIRDAKFDNRAVSRNGRIDITKATASRDGNAIKHSVQMRARLNPQRSKERPGVLINITGGRRSDPEFLVFGGTIFKVPRGDGKPNPIGNTNLTSSRRTWRFSFSAGEIPTLPARYGWAVVTQRGASIADIAPDAGYVKSPRR